MNDDNSVLLTGWPLAEPEGYVGKRPRFHLPRPQVGQSRFRLVESCHSLILALSHAPQEEEGKQGKINVRWTTETRVCSTKVDKSRPS